jgi:hypothetical protein
LNTLENVTLLYEREIDLGVDLAGYRLIPGFRGEVGLPLEAFLELFAVRGAEIVPVTPERLPSLIERIEDEEDAWKVLRLFISPETHFLFKKDVYVLDLVPDPSRVGGIAPETAERIGYLEPEMRREDEKFVARRDVVQFEAGRPSPQPLALRWRESLSREGAYQLLDEQTIAELSPEEVTLPYYE